MENQKEVEELIKKSEQHTKEHGFKLNLIKKL